MKQRHAIKLDDKKRHEVYLNDLMDSQKDDKDRVDREAEELEARAKHQDDSQKEVDFQI